jgi:hypothetical protein
MKLIKTRFLSPRLAEVEKDYSVIVHGVTASGNEDYFTIKIPVGTRTDGGTILRMFWSPIGLTPWDYFTTAYVIHDYIYHLRGLVAHRKLTREFADKLLRFHLQELGAKKYQQWGAYWYSRVLGWYKWYDIDIWVNKHLNIKRWLDL